MISGRQSRGGTTPIVRGIIVIGAIFLAVGGAWAMFAPESFFERAANWPPYNEHFIHDIGAFQLGLAAVLGTTLIARGGVTVALAGVAVGSAFHAWSHFMDSGEGGRDSDPWVFGVLTLLFVAGLVLHLRSRPRFWGGGR